MVVMPWVSGRLLFFLPPALKIRAIRAKPVMAANFDYFIVISDNSRGTARYQRPYLCTTVCLESTLETETPLIRSGTWEPSHPITPLTRMCPSLQPPKGKKNPAHFISEIPVKTISSPNWWLKLKNHQHFDMTSKINLLLCNTDALCLSVGTRNMTRIFYESMKESFWKLEWLCEVWNCLSPFNILCEKNACFS